MDNISKNLDIEIRTMKSDIEAVKASGGDATSIQFIKMSGEKKLKIVAEETKINIGIAGYAGPEKGIFSSSGEIKGQQTDQKSFFKIIAVAAISILAIAGLGYLTYNIALKILK